MEKTIYIPLIDCVTEITNKQVAMVEDSFVYLDSLETVDATIVDEAIALKQSREAQFEALEYQRLRQAEYPSFAEQLDMQYWDHINGTSLWFDKISEVKSKYPKSIEV